jgi:hypothetical protein
MRIASRVVGISGVAPAANANIPLEVNRRYHTLKLLTTIAGVATLASSVVSTVKVKVNEGTIWEVSVARLLKFNASIGLPDPVGILTLHFSRPDLADIINEEATAFDMFGERSFRVEPTMVNTANVELAAIAYYDFKPNVGADGNPSKIILRLNEYTESFPNGTKDWTTLNKTLPILRILLDAAGTIPAVEVKADDLAVFEATASANSSMLGNYGVDATQFKFPLAFNFTNRLDDGLLVTRSLNVRVTSGAAQDVTALMETFSTTYALAA